jgi:hypothetical protein
MPNPIERTFEYKWGDFTFDMYIDCKDEEDPYWTDVVFDNQLGSFYPPGSPMDFREVSKMSIKQQNLIRKEAFNFFFDNLWHSIEDT